MSVSSRWILGSILLLAAFQFGCAGQPKGFNRGALESQIGVTNAQYDDKEIKDAFKKKSNLPKPFKLAVYFMNPKSGNAGTPEWRWTDQDKALLNEATKELREKGVVSDVFPIVSSLVENESLKSIRMAAAKHHADAVLVVGGISDVDRYLNKYGWTYALLLPTLFVSGSEAETLFLTQATMWDVKNEFLYVTAEAETSTRDTHSAAFGKSNKQLIEEAKTLALTNLRRELKEQIEGRKF